MLSTFNGGQRGADDPGKFAGAGAGLAEIQQATPDIKAASYLCQLIEDDGVRAAEVVGSIRAMFAHGSSEKVPLDINELIREATAPVAGELTARRVTLVLTLDEQMPRVTVDRVQMQQVFLNLVTNAIEAMTSVTDRPRMLAIRSTSSNAGLRVTVEDSGTGIDPGHSQRLFDPFFTTKPQGTGMGLSCTLDIRKRPFVTGGSGSALAARCPGQNHRC